MKRIKKFKPTAAETYAARARHIARLRNLLQMGLDAHAKQANATPRDWSFAGDLGKVRDALITLVSFVKNVSPEDIADYLIDTDEPAASQTDESNPTPTQRNPPMRITELHLAATNGNSAILRRHHEERRIEVQIVTPSRTCNRSVEAGSEEGIASMANYLYETLEGRCGTRGDVMEYQDAIQQLSDL